MGHATHEEHPRRERWGPCHAFFATIAKRENKRTHRIGGTRDGEKERAQSQRHVATLAQVHRP